MWAAIGKRKRCAISRYPEWQFGNKIPLPRQLLSLQRLSLTWVLAKSVLACSNFSFNTGDLQRLTTCEWTHEGDFVVLEVQACFTLCFTFIQLHTWLTRNYYISHASYFLALSCIGSWKTFAFWGVENYARHRDVNLEEPTGWVCWWGSCGLRNPQPPAGEACAGRSMHWA